MAYDDIVLKGYVYDDAGNGISGATVKVYQGDSAETSTHGSSLDDTTTSTDGMWTITSSNSATTANNRLDVEVTSSGGGSKRRIKYRDSIQVENIDTEKIILRAIDAGNADMHFFADEADDAGDYWRIRVTPSDTFLIGSDKAVEGTIIDYVTITNGANAAASVVALGGSLTVGGDLTVSGDDITMNTNTDTAILVADGTNYNPVVPSGVIDLANDGAFTLDNTVISSQTEITSGVVVADELLYSDGGVIKKIGLDNFVELTPALATEDAIADGDYILFLDGGATGNMNKEAVHDLATLFAGAGMTATSSVVNVIGGDGITANSNDVAVTAAQTTITSVLNASLVIGRDGHNDIDFTTDNTVRFRVGDEDQLTLTDGALTPSSNAIVDLGTDALEFKDAYFDGTLEADTITIGGTNILTGAIVTTVGTITAGTWEGTAIASAYLDADTAHLSGTQTFSGAKTFSAAATLATGTTIGNLTLADGSITDSGGALDFGNETLTTTGVITAGGFTIGSAAILEAELEILDGATVTTTELNLIDGDTARGTTAVASGDGLLVNDGGTMRMTNVDTVGTYLAGLHAGTVTSTGLSDSSGVLTLDIQNMTVSTTIADADLLVIDDGAGGTLRKMTRANFIESAALDSINIDGGAIDGTAIGASSASTIVGTTIDASTDFTVGTTVITDDVITFTPTTSDTVTMTATTNGAFSLVTVDNAAAAANIQITADGTVDIDSAGVLTLDSGAAINIEPASGSAILLDGTISIDAGVVTGATSVTSTAFVGTIDGVVGGNTPAAITGTTIDANTDFTIGATVITDGVITDASGLSIAAAVDLGSNTLTSTGSMQIRTIDYSDGDLAMTIADGGGVSFAAAHASLSTTMHTSSSHIDRNMVYENVKEVTGVTSYATQFTLTPSVVSNLWTRGIIYFEVSGHTSAAGSGTRSGYRYFDIADDAPTVGDMGSDRETGTPPAFRVTTSTNDILLQVQSYNASNAIDGTLYVKIMVPRGAGSAGGSVTYSVT